ncbi:hypothetical protein [Microbulbifer epialgicus]|uniref:Uncharacterized protein n=1 Tax=Microbulbifer epialgicus TaxID=393907 RepID=A0ABV4NV87_9GAMM
MPKGYSCKQRFGVIAFDDVKSPASGWACISKDTPFYFLSVKELPSDVLWLANTDHSNCNDIVTQKVVKVTNIKSSNYLFTPISNLLKELGLHNSTNSTQVAHLAVIFESVMNYHSIQTGHFEYRKDFLNDEIRYKYLPNLYVTADEQVFIEALESIIRRHKGKRSRLFNQRYCTPLLFHRSQYSRYLLEQQIPIGTWKKIPSVIIELGKHKLFEWISNYNKPLLLSVYVNFKDDLAERLFKISNFNSKNIWVTVKEYFWLYKYAEVDISQILSCDGYAPVPVSIPDFGNSNYLESSYSFGIYCESLWTSMAYLQDFSTSSNFFSLTISMWILGTDNAICLEKAYELEKNNPDVISDFGYGRLLVKNQTKSGYQIPDIAFKSGLISPMSESDDIEKRHIPKSPSFSQFMQIVMERGVLDFIHQIDTRALDNVIDFYDQKIDQSNNSIKISI